MNMKETQTGGKSPTLGNMNRPDPGWTVDELGAFAKYHDDQCATLGRKMAVHRYREGYALTLARKKSKHGKGVKIFVESGGRDNPVPCQLQQNSSGQWKLTEYSSFCMDVRPTATEEGDF